MKTSHHIGKLSLLACALLACQWASADDEFVNPDWANSAWYIGAGIGRSAVKIDEERIIASLRANAADSVSIQSDERSTAYKIFLGKQLSRHFALEGGYFDLGNFGFNAITTPAGTLNGKVGFKGGNLDLLAQLPMTERFSVYGKLGMSYVKTTTQFTGNRLYAVTNPNPSERKFNPKVGVGVEFKLSEALAMRAEVERHRLNDAVGNRGDADLFAFNLVYKLGRPVARATMTTMPPVQAQPEPVVVAQPAPPPPPPPAPPPPVPVSEKVTFSANALFDFDKSVLKPSGAEALDTLLASLKDMNTEVMVTVGHTDSVGTAEYNEKLALRRAGAVKDYLISKGVDAARIYTEGKGETMPVADNATAAGRAANRRVTVEVVGTRRPH